MLAIGAAAGRRSRPERHRVGGVGRDGSDSGEQQRRKGDKAASPRDGVKGAAESSGEKKKDCSVQAQVQDVSQRKAAEVVSLGNRLLTPKVLTRVYYLPWALVGDY